MLPEAAARQLLIGVGAPVPPPRLAGLEQPQRQEPALPSWQTPEQAPRQVCWGNCLCRHTCWGDVRGLAWALWGLMAFRGPLAGSGAEYSMWDAAGQGCDAPCDGASQV